MKKLLFLAIFSLLYQFSDAQDQTITGFFKENTEQQLQLEASFDKNLNVESIDKNLKLLSSKPHHLSSPGSKTNAEYILGLYKKWGWDAAIETFHVLFPTPKTRILEMTSPTSYKAILKEPELPEDPDSGQTGQLPTYNAYSADGDVSGELIFVNYGLPDDYKELDKMGIDVKGKIVIAKYGRSWRGTKPKVAQEHGAIGCIIYSDPMDDGYFKGDVYPKGAFKNEYGVQRGSVMDMVIYPGDPLTPGIGATKDAKRYDRLNAPNLLKIPVLPISYHDATPLLKALEGPVVPNDWQGGLPFAYHVGPGKTKVHLKVEFSWDIVPCYNVIAKIKGSKFPDEWIIRGNHQDAWVNGAADPISGLSAMLEEAKSIGNLLKTGWKPDRTLVYCAWDGEEPGLIGSTEWLETHQKELQQKAVVYINSDGNSRGFLYAQGSHALEPLMDEIAKTVIDPQTKVSVFERKKARDAIMANNTEAKEKDMNKTSLKLGAMGSGSDYSAFIQHAGIPALNLGYGGEGNGGEYHSIYDSYHHFTTFKDPGLKYEVTLAQTAGRAVLRMANADVLPFDYTHLYTTINGYASELEKLLDDSRKSTQIENELIAANAYKVAQDPTKKLTVPATKSDVPYLDFSPIQNSLVTLKKETDSLKAAYRAKINDNKVSPNFNRSLYRAEQQLLNKDGLPRRDWYKHTIYAPGFYTGYGVKTMPGIREAIEQRNWNEAQQQIKINAEAINRLADYLETAYKVR
ncbi:M28 family peptidase [Flavobacteriaceae bacterium F89]|uniref:M28 family peptidase n=1 Tax=Cerina litoralis TaxID=2874477 RepID=A0AAE3EUL6_9FLAO|nr:transferrin receptor-like dimerization domain-containing protein [Cerina litoralis]MCG2459937.1 M28 family peptidase [Cerina litoralis]